MEVKEKASSLEPDNNGTESFVVDIRSVEAKEAKGSPSKVLESPKKAAFMDSPEISRFSPSPNKPPRSPAPQHENLTRRKTLNRSVFSRPKSRFGETSAPIDTAMVEEHASTLGSPYRNSFNMASPNNISVARTISMAQKSNASPGRDDFEEIYKKTLLLKILASSFHVNTFFDRIQESIFHQYVLQTLSGPPLIEEAERVGRSPSMGQLSFTSTKKGKKKEKTQVIDIAQLHKMKQEKVSAWTMKVLIDAVSSSGLSTISNQLDEMEIVAKEQNKEITSEMEATAAAYHIFRNVAQPGCKYIDEDDLMRFMIKEEVDLVLPLIGTENGRVDRKALTDWVVKVYNGRKALGHALSDTKTAVSQLNKLVTAILVVVTIVIWLLLMEIATTKVLVFLSSQLVVAAFVFGNTCKTIFEAIVFVFIMHPFDVGDRCVVDGVALLVEEMNILTTVFLKLNNEKVYYPNSVLSTKPISNYYRSSDMGDAVEFSIDFNTTVEKIAQLKEKFKKYIEMTPLHWHPTHSVVVIEIENVNKLKMALYVNHTITFQEFGEKNRRRTELVMEVKRVLEELNIKYYLLPQTIHVNPIELDSSLVQK
uniref:Mechanosensitive ion channel MscS domain-containing protein n=1 Tax=Cannabis sativa TaxID=3483 RepID=A0A803NFT9_CANSA